MVSIKISRGKFPRPGPGTSALRMLLRLTAVKGRRAEKKILESRPPLLSQGLDHRPPPHSPHLSEGLYMPRKDQNGPEKKNSLHKRKNKQDARDT